MMDCTGFIRVSVVSRSSKVRDRYAVDRIPVNDLSQRGLFLVVFLI